MLTIKRMAVSNDERLQERLERAARAELSPMGALHFMSVAARVGYPVFRIILCLHDGCAMPTSALKERTENDNAARDAREAVRRGYVRHAGYVRNASGCGGMESLYQLTDDGLAVIREVFGDGR